jgi:hypothetical protein
MAQVKWIKQRWGREIRVAEGLDDERDLEPWMLGDVGDAAGDER